MTNNILLWLDMHGGDREGFIDRMSHGQRLGQAFFNSLSKQDQQRCTGTSFDPFYCDEPFGVHVAMDRLSK